MAGLALVNVSCWLIEFNFTLWLKFYSQKILQSVLYVYTVVLGREDAVQDLFFETVALQRIILFSKLVSSSDCTEDEKNIAIAWMGELTAELEHRVCEFKNKNPHDGGCSDGGRSLQ